MSVRIIMATVAVLAVATTALPAAAQTRIALGQSVNGELRSADPTLNDGSHFDCFVLEPGRGTVTIDLSSGAFDTFLAVGTGSDCSDAMTALATDDDGAGGTNSRISRTFTQPRVLIRANAFGRGETGGYTLRVSAGASNAGVAGPASAPARTGQRVSLSDLAEIPGTEVYRNAMVCAAVDMFISLQDQEDPDVDSMRISNALVSKAKQEGVRHGFDEDQVVAHLGDMLIAMYGDPEMAQQARALRADCRRTVR